MYQGRFDEAYSRFYKSTWNGAWQDAGYFACARISCMHGRYEEALYEVDRALLRNWHSAKARALKTAILRRMGRDDEARQLCRESLAIDRFNYGCLFVEYLITADTSALDSLIELMHGNAHNYDEIALDFCAAGLWPEAEALWKVAIESGAVTPMTRYYLGWALLQAGDEERARKEFAAGAAESPDMVFPNRLEAISALRAAIAENPADAFANHYLGNLFYDKRQYDLAQAHWEHAAELKPDYPTVWRNLALLYYNKRDDASKALECMERAFSLDETDSRVLMELDQLYKKLQRPHADRLAFLRKYPSLIDLLTQCLEYPHHLGEGKLYGAQENDFYYLLGVCHRATGNTVEAERCFRQATLGPTEPAAAMYYNDAKPDKIFYAGLAFRTLLPLL